ncbi:2-hydroxyacid dehydrogenase [Longimicrobium terrae]|uniref:Glyoxylate reductase n=1 Tax=Longimicrobium terrae TaxID=1639882 RepID=A0A841H628_9BACT|nr:D-glycerate dehydrogenase [Longimicrobium terrae]MBB4639073.1 glyoxylate reductase [Longimicrobium terrae]MBB6073326.1 glyoxylate reductase [Longimicrobium terrae]NNC28765.1 D-glycerate dehydrogenase [Longimicrobium terrae]
MARIVCTFALPAEAADLLRPLGEVAGPDGWRGELADAEALVCVLTDRVDAELLAVAPNLRIVANAVAGYEHVDREACRARGVVVTNTPDVLTDATADVAFALILGTLRGVSSAERSLRGGGFGGWRFDGYLGADLAGRTLGIYGMGRIGQAVARRAAPFGMRVIYHSRSRLDPSAEAETGARWVAWDELLSSSDVLSLHAPLTPDTRHVLDRNALRRMRRGAFLINTARGPLVDEAALVDALRDGHLAGAGLDVYERDPVVHPGLLELPNVMLLPHIGSATTETRHRMAMLAARNVEAVLSGQPPLTPVS